MWCTSIAQRWLRGHFLTLALIVRTTWVLAKGVRTKKAPAAKAPLRRRLPRLHVRSGGAQMPRSFLVLHSSHCVTCKEPRSKRQVVVVDRFQNLVSKIRFQFEGAMNTFASISSLIRTAHRRGSERPPSGRGTQRASRQCCP